MEVYVLYLGIKGVNRTITVCEEYETCIKTLEDLCTKFDLDILDLVKQRANSGEDDLPLSVTIKGSIDIVVAKLTVKPKENTKRKHKLINKKGK